MTLLVKPLGWKPKECPHLRERMPSNTVFVPDGEFLRRESEGTLFAIYASVSGRLPTNEERDANLRSSLIEPSLLDAINGLDYFRLRSADPRTEEMIFELEDWRFVYTARDESDLYLSLLRIESDYFGTFTCEQGDEDTLPLSAECRDIVKECYREALIAARAIPFMQERYAQFWSED